MNRLFFGNFDFEEQLRGETRRSAKLERLVAELVACWLAVCDEGDRIWCPARMDPAFAKVLAERLRPLTRSPSLGIRGEAEAIFVSDPSQIPTGMELVPWGWSPAAVEFGQRHGLQVRHPPLELVKLANSREFSVPRDKASFSEWEFGELFRTLGQVMACVERVHPALQWVIKANWSHAARERILGRGPRLTEADIAWIKQRLARDGVVCWEAWLSRRSEFGVQWEIAVDGSVHFVAVTELLVDPRGQYAGTLVPGSTTLTPSFSIGGVGERDIWYEYAVTATRPVVEELASLGYFGPVGIDCMRYYDPEAGCDGLRVLQDLNVRWTMGRLAAEWSRTLSGEPILWWHGARETAPEWAQSAEWIATSPDSIDEQSVSHRTWLAQLR
jgi:hypothetical protein